jgi:hypothetical protein
MTQTPLSLTHVTHGVCSGARISFTRPATPRFKVYMGLHIQLAASPLGKPLVMEEFGSTWW